MVGHPRTEAMMFEAMMGDEHPISEAEARGFAEYLRWLYAHRDDVPGVGEYLAAVEEELHLAEYACCARERFEAQGSTAEDLARYMHALDALADWRDALTD